jgi:hypothetical protein
MSIRRLPARYPTDRQAGRLVAAQGHAHVVHLHGDGVAAEQTFVQQFDPGAFDKAQFQQTAFQLDLLP